MSASEHSLVSSSLGSSAFPDSSETAGVAVSFSGNGSRMAPESGPRSPGGERARSGKPLNRTG